MKNRAWFVAVMVLVSSMVGSPALGSGAGDTVGVVDQTTGMWYLRDASNGDTTSFYYGNPGDYPMAGDWDCDGVDTPGLYRQSDGYVYLRNSNSQGVADMRFFFGNPGDMPMAGDFDNDGCDTVSIYRPSQQRFYIINTLGSDGGGLGAAEYSFIFGNPGDKPFVADFNNNGQDTIGLHRESTGLIYFRNANTEGVAEGQLVYGNPGDRIIAGRWLQDPTPGSDTVGIFRPSDGYMYLRFSNTQGSADIEFPYGNRDMSAVAGYFGNLPGGDQPPPRDGDLDQSFGANGIVLTGFPGGNEHATAVAVQRDGKIVAVGIVADGFGLARYNQDGALDPTFGTGGMVVTDFGTDNDQATAMAIQADGKIVVAGRASDDVALVRYEPDGTLDPTFSGGVVTAGLPGGYNAGGLALQRDGKIVVAGSFAPEGAGSFNEVLVMRFLADGSFDPTFGSDGLVTTAGASASMAVAVQTDGKIVATGWKQTTFACSPSDPCDVAITLVRYNRDGSLDPSFGVGGKVTTGRPGETNEAYAIVVQPDGKIVVSGARDTRPVAYSHFLLVRYNRNGSLDSSFGMSGEVVTDFGGNDVAFAIARQVDSKIIVAGVGRMDDGFAAGDFAVARYHPDGTLDTSFGIEGKVLVDAGDPSRARALVIQSDGNIVAAGRGGDGQSFALVRLLATGVAAG